MVFPCDMFTSRAGNLKASRLQLLKPTGIFEMLLTLPVGSCSCERSFSAMRRLKTWQRSTMGESRSNGLALMNIHSNNDLGQIDPIKVLKQGIFELVVCSVNLTLKKVPKVISSLHIRSSFFILFWLHKFKIIQHTIELAILILLWVKSIKQK